MLSWHTVVQEVSVFVCVAQDRFKRGIRVLGKVRTLSLDFVSGLGGHLGIRDSWAFPITLTIIRCVTYLSGRGVKGAHASGMSIMQAVGCWIAACRVASVPVLQAPESTTADKRGLSSCFSLVMLKQGFDAIVRDHAPNSHVRHFATVIAATSAPEASALPHIISSYCSAGFCSKGDVPRGTFSVSAQYEGRTTLLCSAFVTQTL